MFTILIQHLQALTAWYWEVWILLVTLLSLNWIVMIKVWFSWSLLSFFLCFFFYFIVFDAARNLGFVDLTLEFLIFYMPLVVCFLNLVVLPFSGSLATILSGQICPLIQETWNNYLLLILLSIFSNNFVCHVLVISTDLQVFSVVSSMIYMDFIFTNMSRVIKARSPESSSEPADLAKHTLSTVDFHWINSVMHFQLIVEDILIVLLRTTL